MICRGARCFSRPHSICCATQTAGNDCLCFFSTVTLLPSLQIPAGFFKPLSTPISWLPRTSYSGLLLASDRKSAAYASPVCHRASLEDDGNSLRGLDPSSLVIPTVWPDSDTAYLGKDLEDLTRHGCRLLAKQNSTCRFVDSKSIRHAGECGALYDLQPAETA